MKNKLRWLFWFLVVFFLVFVISRFAELKKLTETIAGGQWQWLLIAATLQIVYYVCYAGLYKAAFATVEVRGRIRELLLVLFASMFVNVAAPFGGTSGTALFVDDARRRGESPARAAAGTILVLVADFSSFLLILLGGMVYLFLAHDLKIYEIAAAVALLLLTGGQAFILLLGIRRPDLLDSLLTWFQTRVNRIAAALHRPDFITPTWAATTAEDFTGASLAISTHSDQFLSLFGIGLITQIIDLASLWAVFQAFHQPVHLGVLVAGFSIGLLFWIISITPQGIGVVEGIMPLVLASLGIPIERATVVALVFRGLTFWIPMLIGFILLRRLRIFNASAGPISSKWPVRLVGFLTAVMGIVNVISAVTPSVHSRFLLLMQESPLAAIHGSRLTAALSGFALLLLANGLWRRKRVAWFMAIWVLVLSAASHILKGLDYEEAILSLLLAGWIFTLRSHFQARSDPPSMRQGLLALLAAVLFTLFYGTVGFYFLDRQFSVNFSLPAAIQQTFLMFISYSNPGLTPVTRLGRYFVDSIYIISAVSLSYAALMLIRPILVRRPPNLTERQRAQQIVERFGCSTLAPFALLEDKSYFFSSGGSLIQYVFEGRVGLALGDPIGPAEDLPKAIHEFRAYCELNDWLPAFYQVMPEGLAAYRSEEFQEVEIGEEAIVDLAEFSLEGRDMKGLRSGYNKLVRMGYQSEAYLPPLPQHLVDELRDISDAWLALVHGTEKRFSLGWFYDDYVRRNPVMTVCDPNGVRVAFANILREYQRKEVTIDLMRHLPNVENGVMDYLFVILFQWAKENGYETFNLGLSALAGVGETPQDPAIERALHYIYEHVNQFYNFKGLHKFKEKFHPSWSPRYLIFPGYASLPLVVVAMIRADSGGDLLSTFLKK